MWWPNVLSLKHDYGAFRLSANGTIGDLIQHSSNKPINGSDRPEVQPIQASEPDQRASREWDVGATHGSFEFEATAIRFDRSVRAPSGDAYAAWRGGIPWPTAKEIVIPHARHIYRLEIEEFNRTAAAAGDILSYNWRYMYNSGSVHDHIPWRLCLRGWIYGIEVGRIRQTFIRIRNVALMVWNGRWEVFEILKLGDL